MAVTLRRGNGWAIKPHQRLSNIVPPEWKGAGSEPNTVELSLCNRIRRAATLCRRGKNKFIVGMGMPTYPLIQQYWVQNPPLHSFNIALVGANTHRAQHLLRRQFPVMMMVVVIMIMIIMAKERIFQR